MRENGDDFFPLRLGVFSMSKRAPSSTWEERQQARWPHVLFAITGWRGWGGSDILAASLIPNYTDFFWGIDVERH